MSYKMVDYPEGYIPGLRWDKHETSVRLNWSEWVGTKISFWHPVVWRTIK